MNNKIKRIIFLICVIATGVVFFTRSFALMPFYSTDESIEKEGWHMITNFFDPSHPFWFNRVNAKNLSQALLRRNEILGVLNTKLRDERIAKVHIFYHHPHAEVFLKQSELVTHKHKLQFHWMDRDPSYYQVVDFINNNLLNKLVLFFNQDIEIGEGWHMVNRSAICDKKITYVLSRSVKPHQNCIKPGENCIAKGHKTYNSDAYVICLKQPLNLKPFLPLLDRKTDDLSVESNWIQAFKENQFKVLNPCLTLRVYHVHCYDIHSKSRVRVGTRYDGDQFLQTDELY